MTDRQFIRYVLLFLHWGWAIIIALPGDVIMHYRAYTMFQLTGGSSEWLWRSVAMATIATIAILRVPLWFRELSTFLQAAWLVMLAGMFAAYWPPQTGAVAYLSFASLATWLVVRLIRDGDG